MNHYIYIYNDNKMHWGTINHCNLFIAKNNCVIKEISKEDVFLELL